MKSLKGKKLLVLAGKPVGTEDIINYAHSQGVYVIVADYLPAEKSVGKRMADEVWDISTAEVDKIEELARAAHVDGIYTGVHEFNIMKAIELCERLNLPFYASREHWNIGTDKALFKKICEDYDLPCAQSYKYEDKSHMTYPVIVKPVDASSGKGISICKNEEELDVAIKVALEESIKKEYMIEQYLYGDEFAVDYSIVNGESKLAIISDFYYNYDQEVTQPLPQVYIHPSRYIDEYMKSVDEKVRHMLKGLSIKDGFFWLQGFKNKDGFFFFEPGFRPGGSAVWRWTKHFNNISCIEMLVNYSLTGEMCDDLNKENAYYPKPCSTLSIVAKGGTIGQINGYEELSKLQSVISSECRFNVGDTIRFNSALGQVALRFFIVEDTHEKLFETINYIQDNIQLLDVDGNDMLIKPFDTKTIENFYNK